MAAIDDPLLPTRGAASPLRPRLDLYVYSRHRDYESGGQLESGPAEFGRMAEAQRRLPQFDIEAQLRGAVAADRSGGSKK